MSEADLNTYKLQLQQVEAALTTDPDNEVQFQYLSAEHLFVISILGAFNTQKWFGTSPEFDNGDVEWSTWWRK